MFINLPEELIINILQRVHIKTLLRCRSVCKSWYSLITSSHFISTHLNFNNNLTPHLLVGYYKKSCNSMNYALYYDNDSFDLHTQFVFPFEYKYECYFNIVGSCNGLICFHNYSRGETDDIVLWNPFINKTIYLPDPIYVSRSPCPSLGFGFDSVTNDYKVVRMLHTEDDDGFTPKAEVFRLSTGIWEDISHLALPCTFPEPKGVYVNGAAHWLGWYQCQKFVIVVFDMHNEVFREMMLPSSLAGRYLWGDDLYVYQGLLCLMHWRDRRKSFIWLMKEYGAAESWIEQFNLDVDSLHLILPRGFRNNREILWATDKWKLISYNPQNKEMKGIDIHGVGRFEPMIYHFAHAYVESLVLLDKRGEVLDSDPCNIVSNVEFVEENHGPTKRKRRSKTSTATSLKCKRLHRLM